MWQDEALARLRAKYPELNRHPVERRTIRWLGQRARLFAATRYYPQEFHQPDYSTRGDSSTVEPRPYKPEVAGPNPARPTTRQKPAPKRKSTPLKGINL